MPQENPQEQGSTMESAAMASVAQQIKALSDKVGRYMAASEESPTHGLFLAGIKSALEHMASSCHKHNEELEKMLMQIGEMRAMMGESAAGIRSIRNRFFCMAGESAQRQEERRVEDRRESDQEKPKP